MDRIQLNGTELEVSPICIGTMHYGDQLNAEESARQLDMFVDNGGNFIDTAHVYGTWIPDLGSSSEEYIGKWLSSSKHRSDVIISTKGAHPAGKHKEISRVSPKEIKKDLEESLRLLKTDYIDLYFLHRDDDSVPVEIIIDTLESAKREGKIRYYAASNWSIKRIEEAKEYAFSIGGSGFSCSQIMFSLADVKKAGVEDKTLEIMDWDTYNYHASTKLSVMSFTSLAKGYFMKRYKKQTVTAPEVYETASNDKLFDFLLPFVENGDFSFTELSFLYQIAITDFQAIPIASFHQEWQLKEALASCNKALPPAILSGIKSIKQFVC